MGKLSRIRLPRRHLLLLAMLPVLSAATLHAQAPAGALVVSEGLFFGGEVFADSFDSADPMFSTSGQYDPAKDKADGDIRSSSGFNIGGSSTIRGRVWAPSFACSGSASVGDLNWVRKGVQPGWWQPGTPFQVADVTAPYSDAPQPSFSGVLVIRGVTNWFDGIIGDGQYLLLTNTSLAVTGAATVFAPNGFNGWIGLASGARLNMYVGTDLRLTDGQADFATNLVINCLPSVTNVALIDIFTGVIYAPEANVVLAGGSEIFGSIAAKTVTANGTCYLHYDEQIWPPMRPALASPRFVSGIGLEFEVSGSSGSKYVVETSTNLTDWIPSSTNASPFTYTDPDASLFPNRFYRARKGDE